MRITVVQVEYGRTLSDGKYGSERASVALTSEVAEGEDFRAIADLLGDEATHLTIGRLKRSTSEAVLQALETPQEREARWDRERDQARERKRLRDAEDAEPAPAGRSDEEDDASDEGD